MMATDSRVLETDSTIPGSGIDPCRRSSLAAINVGLGERAVSAFGGGALLLFGLGRRSLPGAVLAVLGGGLLYRGLTGHCSVYQTLGITDEDADGASTPLTRISTGRATVTIEQPVERVYQFWRDVPNLSLVTPDIQEVCAETGGRDSHWIAHGPGEQSIEWDAEITADVENERIAWRTMPGSDVPHSGDVTFCPAPGGRGTEVQLALHCQMPLGAAGAVVAKLMRRSPADLAEAVLKNARRVLETQTFTPAAPNPLTSDNLPRVTEASPQEDIVDEGSELSFPASDPPSYTAGR